jgi:hypothetical protein
MTGLNRYLEWVEQRKELWTHVHLSSVALKVGGAWFSVAGGVTLSPSPTTDRVADPIMEWDDACRLYLSGPVSLLQDLVEDVRTGAIPASRVPGLDRTLLIQSPFGTPYTDEGGTELTGPGVRAYGAGDWLRFDSRLRGAEVAKLYPAQQEAHEAIERANKVSEGLGHGTIAEICDDLGLRDLLGGSFNASTWVAFRFQARTPFRLVECKQDDARERVVATVEIPASVPRTGGKLVYRQSGHPPRSVPIPTGGPTVTAVVAEQPPVGDAEVMLVYAGMKVSSEKITVRPPLRTWPVVVAVAALDDQLGLLREGLSGADAMRHERAVAHLLGLLGFSSFWWGPNTMQKKLPLPKDAPDVVLCSNDQQLVVVIECTTEEPPDKKLRYLVDRTRGVATALTSALKEDAPFIRPLLALARPRKNVPQSLFDSLEADGAGLMTLEDSADLLEMVERGVPRVELMNRFEDLFRRRDSLFRGPTKL